MNPERQNNRDQRAEVLLRFFALAKNINTFPGKTIEKVFENEASIRKAVADITFEEFTELITGINGILRDKSKDGWEMDGKNVTLDSMFFGSNTPPHYRDKLDLLQKVLNAAKEMNTNNRSLEDIGILLGVGISEIHPFNDANGRTGRLLYTFLSYGNNKEKIREVLDEHGRNSADFDIKYIESVVQQFIQYKILKEDKRNFSGLYHATISGLEFDPSISQSVTESFKAFLKQNLDSSALVIAVYEWVRDNKKDEVFQNFPGRVVITLERLTPLLQEGDLQNIQEKFWGFKRETAELLIDSMVNPNKPQYVGNGEFPLLKGSILEHIKKFIITHYAKYRVAGK